MIVSDIISKFRRAKPKNEDSSLTQKSNSELKIEFNQEKISEERKTLKSNWHEERYDTLIVQRNILFLLLMVFLILSITTIIAIAVVIESKRFDPFVIQVDETTGMARIVDPTTSETLEANDSLARYFIKKYIIARETYNPVDFDTQAKQVIRVLSAGNIFWSYVTSLKNEATNPAILYGQKNTTSLTVKSWSKLDTKKYMVRFAVMENAGSQMTRHKIAIVDFDYVPMELTESDRDLNPIGFQVKGYRVDDDNS
jgi:type IV secretion system protein VirB8